MKKSTKIIIIVIVAAVIVIGGFMLFQSWNQKNQDEKFSTASSQFTEATVATLTSYTIANGISPTSVMDSIKNFNINSLTYESFTSGQYSKQKNLLKEVNENCKTFVSETSGLNRLSSQNEATKKTINAGCNFIDLAETTVNKVTDAASFTQYVNELMKEFDSVKGTFSDWGLALPKINS